MSSIRFGIAAACLSICAQGHSTQAQEAYGPGENAMEDGALPSCDDLPPDEDTIVVCSELVDPETVMSVIPPEPDLSSGDIPRAPALAEPPCWITGNKTLCIRRGKVPEFPPLIDMTAFPEQLSEAEAAQVMQAALPAEERDKRASRALAIGKRVAIDLEEVEPDEEEGG